MEQLCRKYNIPTQFTNIIISFPISVQAKLVIPDKLQTNIGLIYGISIYTDTVTADNQTLITTTEAGLLYLVLKKGSADFIDSIRLDDLLFQFSGVPTLPAEKYLNVHIPAPFSLDQSFIANPTGIVAPAPPGTKAIQLNLWYINMNIWRMIEKEIPEFKAAAAMNEQAMRR
jgi:hypothetical protein